MRAPNKVYIISPLDKGYQIDSTDESGKPVKWGSSTKKNAINSVLKKIPSNHQILIADMGEIK